MVAIKRINTFLNKEELDANIIDTRVENEHAIELNDASFTWDRYSADILQRYVYRNSSSMESKDTS